MTISYWTRGGACAFSYLALSVAAGCSDHGPEEQRVANMPASGTLHVPLVTPLQSQYRLRAALFDITTRGQVPVTSLDSELDPNADSLDVDLPTGFYQVSLHEGWRLEQLGDAGASPVSAALLTPNPLDFEVANSRVTELVYTFTTDRGIVSFGSGSLSVSVRVASPDTLPACDLLDAASCSTGQTCLLADEGSTFCAEPGKLKVGSPCSEEQCVQGAQCLALHSNQPDNKVCTRFCNAASPRPGCDCRGLATPAGVGVCMPREPGGQFSFSGVATDLPISELEGWTLCFADTFAESSSIGGILSACNEGQLLLGCRMAGSDVLQVAANAPVADVTFDTGTGNVPHVANGVGWYFNDSYSWGFAPEGSPIQRSSCDIVSSGSGSEFGDGDQRLCYHTGGGALSPGWRCGLHTGIFDGSFERLVFQAPL